MAYTTIDDPSAHFHIQLHTGTGSAQTVTNDANAGDFKPDWIWIKNRDETDSQMLSDSNRGSTKALSSQDNIVEFTPTNGDLAFLTDGYSFGSNNNYNRSSDKFVAWQWIANGGTTSTDTNGAVNSTVQANTTAGFSIVTWTSAGSTNVGHGLGVAPNLIIIKARNATENWLVGSDEIVWTKRIRLNLTDGSATSSAFGQAPTSSIFYCSPASSSYNYVAYCFAEKQGYSKFGSYTGNGSEDGPFVYTGFKPQWILFKNAGAAEEWVLQDTTRNPNNPVTKNIRVDSNIAEADASSIDIDFLSNGFKNRSDQAQVNSSGVTYIYMAFAEHPFVSSEGVPTTAR